MHGVSLFAVSWPVTKERQLTVNRTLISYVNSGFLANKRHLQALGLFLISTRARDQHGELGVWVLSFYSSVFVEPPSWGLRTFVLVMFRRGRITGSQNPSSLRWASLWYDIPWSYYGSSGIGRAAEEGTVPMVP